MMNNSAYLNRSGLAAIAAATAFLATPALAQDAAPVASDPAPIVADTPLPEAAPAESTPAPAATADTLAPTAATTQTRVTRSATPVRAKSATIARSATAAAPVVTSAARAPTATPTPVTDTAVPVDPAMVAPLPEPVAIAPVAAADSGGINDTLPIAGAAGLGLMALAGAGFAMRRRRREDEVMVDEEYREPATERAERMPLGAPMPVAQPVMAPVAVANPKTAFNWGNAPIVAALAVSRIEAARRGPTPDNPSQSLKKRLQRAAFFDQRERAVAAGTAVPVSPMAGLPDALAKPAVTRTAPPRRPAPSVAINRSFQPA